VKALSVDSANSLSPNLSTGTLFCSSLGRF
jgi:hypothetical protein